MATKREDDDLPSVSFKPGIGVDARGGAVIDPTKNVESLVRALEQTTEKLRTADARRLDDLRIADEKLRAADARRVDDLRAQLAELAAMKERYDRQIFDIQTVQVKTTSDLISAQLSKETASLANQINAASLAQQGLTSTLSERIGRLEQSRWEVQGRSSVADPAVSEGLARLTAEMRQIKVVQETMSTMQTGAGGVIKGREDASAAMNRTIMILLGIGMLVLGVLGYIAGKGGHVP